MNPSILHLSSRPFWCGESNRVLVVCRGLHSAGWRVLLGTPPDSPLGKKAGQEGIRVDTRFRFPRGLRLWGLLKDARILRRLYRDGQADIVHLHTSIDTWVAALAFGFCRRGKRPVVIRTRHSDHVSGSDVVHRWLYRHCIDHVVLSSDALRAPLSGLFRAGVLTDSRVTVIHSSVNVERFNPQNVKGDAIRKAFGFAGKFCIGLVGRISPEKGQAALLGVLPDILKAIPNAVCVFVGEGEHEMLLRSMVEKGALQGAVCFAGFRTDIPEMMAAMDVVVVPSNRVESSPGVVKEAMAMNKPVIASDVGGVVEIIRHGVDGLVIPCGDDAALRDAILTLHRDDSLRNTLASRARARIVSDFSDACLIANTTNLYLKWNASCS